MKFCIPEMHSQVGMPMPGSGVGNFQNFQCSFVVMLCDLQLFFQLQKTNAKLLYIFLLSQISASHAEEPHSSAYERGRIRSLQSTSPP